MNDLVPFLLALRKLDANLQAEVGLDERFQHVRDLAEADARLMVRIYQRGAQNGMLVALDADDLVLSAADRAARVHDVYLSMVRIYETPSDAAQASDTERNVTFGPEGQRIDKRPGQFCHADDDGDCTWTECPQLRDGEPAKSRRHCPLDVQDEEA
jgi:hypothetical protein